MRGLEWLNLTALGSDPIYPDPIYPQDPIYPTFIPRRVLPLRRSRRACRLPLARIEILSRSRSTPPRETLRKPRTSARCADP
jgi:hypothetical protein